MAEPPPGQPWVRLKVGHEETSAWFHVPAAPDIATFKKNIKNETPIDLAHCDAHRLTVYRATRETVQRRTGDGAQLNELDSLPIEVEYFWVEAPPKGEPPLGVLSCFFVLTLKLQK